MKHLNDLIQERLKLDKDTKLSELYPADYSTRDLTYYDELDFERAFIKFANKTFGKDVLKHKNIKVCVYFDGDDCIVDSNNDRTIPGVTWDGKMTWAEAIEKLIEYFKTTYNL